MLKHTSLFMFSLVFFVSLCIYGITVYPYVGGSLDSPELQICGKMLGISHPTGYPFYMLVSKLMAWLPLGTLAVKTALISVVSMAFTCAILYRSAYFLSQNKLSATLVTFTFMIRDVVWGVATVTEVYSFQMMISSSAIMLFLLYLHYPKNYISCTLAFLLGLGMVHHLMTMMILVGIALTLFIKGNWPRLNSIKIHLLLFVIPLLFYLYLPIRNIQNAHSFDLYSFQGISDYFIYIFGGNNTGLLRLDFDWFLREGFLQGVVYTLQHFGIVMSLLAVIGVYELVKHKRIESVFLVFVTTIHIALTGIWTEADRDAIVLPAMFCMSIMSAVGLYNVIDALKNLCQSKRIPVSTIVIVVCLLGLHAAYYSHQAIQERNALEQYAVDEAIYKHLPPHSVVLTMYWRRVNAWKYFIYSGEYPNKNIHAYRWNDPRANADWDDITAYMKGQGTIGPDAMKPNPRKEFYLLEPCDSSLISDPLNIIPFKISPTIVIHKIQLKPS